MLRRNSTTVLAAINKIYVVFSDAPKPRKIWVDYFYAETLDANVLNTKPLRKLTIDDLDKYSLGDANKDDILYLLPRYLELFYTQDYYPVVFFFYAISDKCDWNGWTIEHKQAVENYMTAILSIFDQESTDVLAWFCAFSKLFTLEEKHLNLLLCDTSAARENLISLDEKVSRGLPDRLKIETDFLGLPPSNPNYKILLDWFNRQEVFEKVMLAYAS